MDEERKSRTQIKNEAKELQKIGKQLMELSPDQLANMDLPEALSSAVKDARQMRQHEAKRRQLQYIGKLMREVDSEPILKSLRNIRCGDRQKALVFKKIESWRDALKKGDTEIINEILAKCPAAQRQRLNQLSRNAGMPDNEARAARASKALFRYLKEIYIESNP